MAVHFGRLFLWALEMEHTSRLAIEVSSKGAKVDVAELAQALALLDEAGIKVTGTSSRAGKAAADAGREYSRAGASAAQGAAGVDRVNQSMAQTEKAANSAADSLRRTLVAAIGGFSAMSIIDIADGWGQYASRIKMATQSTEEYERAQARMLKSANDTYRNINETREAFIQLSPVLRQMGMSLDQSLDSIDTFSGLLVTNSANAERGAAAMRALSVSLQKGKIDADQWITIYSTVDSIVDLIAESSGKAASEIRALGASGKLSVEMLAKALIDGYLPTMKAVEGMPTTVRDAMQKVASTFGEYIGRSNDAIGVTSALASGIGFLASNLADIADVGFVMAGGAMLGYAGKAAIAGKASYDAMKASLDKAKAANTEAIAVKRAADATLAAAKVDLDKARVSVSTSEAQVAADRVAQASNLERLRSVQQLMAVENAQEVQRIKAQISDVGRQKAATRMAEIRVAEVAIARQVEAAEKSLAATTVASSAQVQAAYAARSKSAEAYAVAAKAANAAAASVEKTAASASLLSRAGASLLGVMGGPAGLAITAGLVATSFFAFRDSADDADKAASGLSSTVDVLTANLEKLGLQQSKNARDDAVRKVEEYQKRLEEINKILPSLERRSMDWTNTAARQKELNDRIRELRTEAETATEKTEQYRQKIGDLERQIRMLQGTATQADLSKGADDAAEAFLANIQKQIVGLQTRNSALAQAEQLLFENQHMSAEMAQGVLLAAQAYDQMVAAQKTSTTSTKSATDAAKEHASALRKVVEIAEPQIQSLDDLQKQLVLLNEAYELGQVSQDGMTRGLLTLNEAYAEVVEKSMPAHIKSINDSIKSYEDQYKQVRQSIRTFGMAESAITSMAQAETRATITRLEDARAVEVQNGVGADRIALLDEELSRLRELDTQQGRVAAAQAENEALAAARQAQDDLTREWERTTDQISQSLTDALMRGFEDGKGFAQNFRDTLKNMFGTLVLRPIIEPIANTAAAGVAQVLGIGGQGSSSSLSGVGNLLNYSSWQMPGDMLRDMSINWAAKDGWQGSVGSWGLENSELLGNIADIAGYAGGIFGSLKAWDSGNYGTSVGTAIGTAILPGIGTGVGSLLGGLFDGAFGSSFASDKRSGSTYTLYDTDGFASQSHSSRAGENSDLQSAQKLLTENLVGVLNNTMQAIGSDWSVNRFVTSWVDSSKGRGGTYSGGVWNAAGDSAGVRDYKDFVPDDLLSFGAFQKGQGHGGTSGSVEEMIAALETDVYQTIIQGFQAAESQFPEYVRKMFAGVDADALELDAAKALITQITTTIETVNLLSAAFDKLPFPNLISLTFDATAALLDLAGGVDALVQAQSTYYQAFYSEEERRAQSIKLLTEAMDGLGYALPETRSEFRALVDGLDLLDETSRKNYVSLLNLSGAAGEYYAYIEQAANDAIQSAKSAADAMLNEYKSAASDAMSALERSISAEKSVLQDAYKIEADALKTSISASQSALTKLQGLANRLTSTLDAMQGSFDPDISRRSAQAQIEAALAIARASGTMPNVDDLSSALSIVAKSDESLFSSFEEYQLDFLRTANLVNELSGLAGEQLTTEERMLAALNNQLDATQYLYDAEISRLDTILEWHKSQYEMLTGNRDATLTVTEAVTGVGASIADLRLVLAGYTPTGSGSGGGQGDAGTGSSTLESTVAGWYRDYLGRDPSSSVDALGLDFWTQSARDYGVGVTFERFLASARENNEKLLHGSHANGLWSVPFDGYRAELHRGETVLPKDEASAYRALSGSMNSGQSSAEEIRHLRATVERLEQTVRSLLIESNRNTGRSAVALDDLTTGRAAPVQIRAAEPLAVVNME